MYLVALNGVKLLGKEVIEQTKLLANQFSCFNYISTNSLCGPSIASST